MIPSLQRFLGAAMAAAALPTAADGTDAAAAAAAAANWQRCNVVKKHAWMLSVVRNRLGASALPKRCVA